MCALSFARHVLAMFGSFVVVAVFFFFACFRKCVNAKLQLAFAKMDLIVELNIV